jgi:cysteine desulfurase
VTIPIYLDGLSTTPLAPEALDAMMDAWAVPGNPGSPHAAGERAAALVERGRADLAELIGASPGEIVFTSGATEADNLAITGTALAALAGGTERRRVVISAIEHKAVISPALRLRRLGFTVDVVPVTHDGIIDLAVLRSILSAGDTLLVSVMAANNETGVVQPIAEVSALARAAGALVHCDAAQMVGKLPVDVLDLDVDYLSISSHKMYGPVGIGALYVAAAAPSPLPLAVGGGQERGLRAGTEPAPLVAGFATAARLARERIGPDGARGARLLSIFLKELTDAGVSHLANGSHAYRIPGVASLVLQGIDAQSLTQSLSREVSLSTGSACTSGQIDTSHVLAAMHLSLEDRASTLRLMFGRYNADDDPVRAARLFRGRLTATS